MPLGAKPRGAGRASGGVRNATAGCLAPAGPSRRMVAWPALVESLRTEGLAGQNAVRGPSRHSELW